RKPDQKSSTLKLCFGFFAHPQAFKRPAQTVAARNRHHGEDGAHRHVLGERGRQSKQRKHQDLRRNGDAIAAGDVGQRFHQRYGARLLHAAAASSVSGTRSAATSSKLRPSPSSVATLPVNACQRSTTTSQKASDSSSP